MLRMACEVDSADARLDVLKLNHAAFPDHFNSRTGSRAVQQTAGRGQPAARKGGPTGGREGDILEPHSEDYSPTLRRLPS